jgi:hypothetical protein
LCSYFSFPLFFTYTSRLISSLHFRSLDSFSFPSLPSQPSWPTLPFLRRPLPLSPRTPLLQICNARKRATRETRIMLLLLLRLNRSLRVQRTLAAAISHRRASYLINYRPERTLSIWVTTLYAFPRCDRPNGEGSCSCPAHALITIGWTSKARQTLQETGVYETSWQCYA